MDSKIVPAIVCIFVVLSGCTASTNIGMGNAQPAPTPEKPPQLTNESVMSYIETTEKRAQYNNHLNQHPTNTSLDCASTIAAKHKEATLVWVECKGGIEYANGKHTDIVAQSTYYVTGQVTKRASSNNVAVNDTVVDDDIATDPGFRVVNFDDTLRNVTISIEDNKAMNLTFGFQLQPKGSVNQNGLPYDFNSTHQMTVHTDTETISARFTPVKRLGGLGHSTIIFILPDGNIVVTKIPRRLT